MLLRNRLRKSVLGVATLLASLSVASAANAYCGSYESGAPQSADELQRLQRAAEMGGANAEINYAKALESQPTRGNRRVTQAEVLVWFQKAADDGSGEAWHWVGCSTIDPKLMRTAFEKSAELGFKPAFEDALDADLFNAGDEADIVKAKHFADLARQMGVKIGLVPDNDADVTETFAAIDACYAVGEPTISETEREAIALDGHADESYVPNNNMKYAEAFANGRGVKRDTKRAIAFVCHAGPGMVVLVAQVQQLQQEAEPDAKGKPFTYCDYVEGGEDTAECASFVEDKDKKIRERALDALTASYTPEQKAAFGALEGAAESYFESHSENEIDGLTGNSWDIVYEVEERGQLRDGLLKTVTRFEQGHFPPEANWKQTDARLNTAYRRALTGRCEMTIRCPDASSTEPLWLKYRDAWGMFGALRYPQHSANAFRTWETLERIAILRDLSADP